MEYNLYNFGAQGLSISAPCVAVKNNSGTDSVGAECGITQAGSGCNTSCAGAKPHGQKDKGSASEKPVSALPSSDQEPTLSARTGSGASPPAYKERENPIMTAARLVLEDGAVFPGESFGAAVSSAGEVVFNTAMTGYTESLTDPSYAGQILAMTWPLVGNYGVPPHLLENGIQKFFESNQIWVKGLVVSEYSQQYSHWNAVESLSQWMEREGVPGIFGIDTRALTKRLRERGTMLGKIIVDDPAGNPQDVEFYDPGKVNLIAQCSCTEITEFKPEQPSGVRIALIDCGAKNNILRSLLRRGATVIRVPWNFDVTTIDYDGLMISNGPGDPQMAEETVENIKKAFELNKPIFGICMGNQLLARAAGATTYRMRYGHRGHNQPVILQGTHQTWITSQNHGYAVDPLRLSDDWEPSYINLNDGTCEGIAHKSKPFSSVQFHPEASGGPRDAGVLFDRFLNSIRRQ